MGLEKSGDFPKKIQDNSSIFLTKSEVIFL